MDAYRSALEKINKFRIHGIPYFDGHIHPQYDSRSFANFPDSICRWMGIPSLHDNGLAEEYHQGLEGPFQHLIFILVDGLSLRLFNRFRIDIASESSQNGWDSHFRDGRYLPLTSICPSTTSAALTTLWTGTQPCEHAIIGYELFLKEFGLIANMITHSVASYIKSPVNISGAGFNPSTFLPVQTLGSHYQQYGVNSYAFQHESIAKSGLSSMLFRQVQQESYTDLVNLWRSVHQLLDNQRDKSFVYIYWSGLDTLSHRAGPDSDQLYREWCGFADLFSHFIKNLRNSIKAKTLVILTADHGQIATSIEPDYDLHNHPDLNRHLVMVPTGESRLPYLNIKPGHREFVENYLQANWQGNFTLLPVKNAQTSGLLGNRNYHQSTIDRMGSHIVFPRGNAYWWWVEKENHLLGRHGGLSNEEMLIPFFALPI